jgi:hypothetical protein
MRSNALLLPLTLAATALLVGCTLQEAKDTASPAPAAGTALPAAAASSPPGTAEGEPKMQAGGPGGPIMGGAPMMGGGMAPPTAPLTPTPELDKKIAAAEKGGDKKAVAAAYATRGTVHMNDAKAGARVKYRAALADYRKALQADPGNAEAKTNKQMIESIYKQMGLPVPGDGG